MENLVNEAHLGDDVKYIAFDFHSELKSMNWARIMLLVDQLIADLDFNRFIFLMLALFNASLLHNY